MTALLYHTFLYLSPQLQVLFTFSTPRNIPAQPSTQHALGIKLSAPKYDQHTPANIKANNVQNYSPFSLPYVFLDGYLS